MSDDRTTPRLPRPDIEAIEREAEMVLALERTEYKNPSGHPTVRADAADIIALVRYIRQQDALLTEAETALHGRGVGSESSVSEELRGCASLLRKDGFNEWARHLDLKAEQIDAALAPHREGEGRVRGRERRG